MKRTWEDTLSQVPAGAGSVLDTIRWLQQWHGLKLQHFPPKPLDRKKAENLNPTTCAHTDEMPNGKTDRASDPVHVWGILT